MCLFLTGNEGIYESNPEMPLILTQEDGNALLVADGRDVFISRYGLRLVVKMKNENLKGHLAMLGCNTMWGLMAPMCKFALHTGEISSVAMASFRMLGATCLFWLASGFTRQEKVASKDMLMLFFAALCGIVLNQGSYTLGVGLTSPADASIITTTTPIIAMIMAAFYLKEPITGKKVSGVFMSAVGAVLLIAGSGQISGGADSSGNVWGDLLVLFAQMSVAGYFVFFKGLISRYSPVTLMKWMFMYASICWLPFAYHDVAAIPFSSLSFSLYGSTGYVVFFGTFLTYLLLPVGQKRLRPTVVSMYNYVQPIVASVVAVWWGMDTFGVLKFLAVALVFGGVYMVTQSKSREQMEEDRKVRLRRRMALSRLKRRRENVLPKISGGKKSAPGM